MKKTRPKWKDTKFDFCIERNYPLLLQNRCRFFYAYSNNWRKTVNYAINFSDELHICVVYLYGNLNTEKIKLHIENLTEKLLIINQQIEKQRDEADVICNFDDIEKLGKDERHCQDLMTVMKRLYPYGIEIDTQDDFAGKRSAVKKIMNDMENQLPSKSIDRLNFLPADTEQITFFPQYSIGADKLINAIQTKCDNDIAQFGCVNLSEVWKLTLSSPFGAYECNWNNYVIAQAMKKYHNAEYLFYKNQKAYDMNNVGFASFVNVPEGFVFKKTSMLEEMVSAMNEIFDMNETDMPTAILSAKDYVRRNINVPLDYASHMWYELFQKPLSDWCYSDTVKYFYKWLVSNVTHHKQIIQSINESTFTTLTMRFKSNKVKLYYDFYNAIGSLAGLYKAEDFESRLNNYLKADVCEDCGKVLKEFAYSGLVHEAYRKETGEELEFTMQDIKKMNKLYGKGEELKCPVCMSNALNVSEEELFDMIQ